MKLDWKIYLEKGLAVAASEIVIASTSIVSKSLLVGSVLLSIIANISPHRKKRRILLSYAFSSNFWGALQYFLGVFLY